MVVCHLWFYRTKQTVGDRNFLCLKSVQNYVLSIYNFFNWSLVLCNMLEHPKNCAGRWTPMIYRIYVLILTTHVHTVHSIIMGKNGYGNKLFTSARKTNLVDIFACICIRLCMPTFQSLSPWLARKFTWMSQNCICKSFFVFMTKFSQK